MRLETRGGIDVDNYRMVNGVGIFTCEECDTEFSFPTCILTPTTPMDSPYLHFDLAVVCSKCGHQQNVPEEPRPTVAECRALRRKLYDL